MTMHVTDAAMKPEKTQNEGAAAHLNKAASKASRRIAPLWPLQHFVAVNPYLGLSDHSFEAAMQRIAQVSGGRMTMPRSFYVEAIGTGRITDADLDAAMSRAEGRHGLPQSLADLKALAEAEPASGVTALPTIADIVSHAQGRNWSGFVAERISAWASGYFDEGQSAWAMPWRDRPPYAAWKDYASRDRSPEIMGLGEARAQIRSLPDSSSAAIAHCAARLELPPQMLELYFHRLLMSINGWASYVRYKVWQAALYGGEDGSLEDLLAICLAWELLLHDAFNVREGWEAARSQYLNANTADGAQPFAADLILQNAYEKAWQRNLISKLAAPKSKADAGRKRVQAAFCIDVRSETFRRAFESLDPGIETIGFAGFFGFAIEYVPLGHETGSAQCPVLLTPQVTVREQVKDADPETMADILSLRLLRRRARRAWKSFKTAAVSSFGFVETMGITFMPKLVLDALGMTRPVPDPQRDGLADDVQARLAPSITPSYLDGRPVGFDTDARIAMAETVLKAMSMTGNFARLVMLAGHGSTSVNNPHASGLDCGACGGHTGEANARVAAAILNDPQVRGGLASKGIAVPEDTVFLGCLHDTTTDEVQIFDEETVPATHRDDLAALKETLAKAGHLARAERSAMLHLADARNVDASVITRSRDWSQVRPEWGLAGCAAFIAAPRQHTAGLDLHGRSFLHSYEWRQDDGFGVLELIMTAPMVVASWISLQYYGSTVDNQRFGSGNKVLHNVVGTLGVLEGNGGDLRTGLPLQSVHDGERFIHEPMRLNVVIAAPIEAMNSVIAKHESVRELVDHGWLHLFAMDDAGTISHHYDGGLQWRPVKSEAAMAA